MDSVLSPFPLSNQAFGKRHEWTTRKKRDREKKTGLERTEDSRGIEDQGQAPMAKTAFFTLSLVGKAVKKSEHTVNYVPGFEATSSDLPVIRDFPFFRVFHNSRAFSLFSSKRSRC